LAGTKVDGFIKINPIFILFPPKLVNNSSEEVPHLSEGFGIKDEGNNDCQPRNYMVEECCKQQFVEQVNEPKKLLSHSVS